MKEETRQDVRHASRETRRLAELDRAGLSGHELAARVAGSSEATAALFASEYSPESELEGAPPEDRV
jgi:hypothetical protein